MEKGLCVPAIYLWVKSSGGALLVLVSRTALTHIVNHLLLGGVCVGHILEDLSATKGSSEERAGKSVQCAHLTLPPPGGRGDSGTLVMHFGVGNGHRSTKYRIQQHMILCSYIPSNRSGLSH